MSLEDFNEFQVYRDPQLWDGEEIGAGQPRTRVRPISSWGAIRFARQTLHDTIPLLETDFIPEIVLSQGETFDANEYKPGTIALIRERSLIYDPTSAGSFEPFVNNGRRPPLLGVNLEWNEGYSLKVSERAWTYREGVRWGVVAQVARKHRQALIAYPASQIYKDSSGPIHIKRPLPMRSTFTVNETAHTKDFRTDTECLYRVLQAYVWNPQLRARHQQSAGTEHSL